MARLTVSLDAFALLRETTGSRDFDLLAAATLADLAGADAVRVGLREELRPVDESDLQALGHSGRALELRVPATQSLMKTVVQAQPGLVAIGGDAWEQPAGASPIDLLSREVALGPMVRGFAEAGIRTALVIPADLASVKAAHTLGVWGVELYTGALVDLPPKQRDGLPMNDLLDAAKLAGKLKMQVALAGGLGPRTLGPLLERVPGVSRVVVGRAFAARAALVGIDAAVRDLRTRVG